MKPSWIHLARGRYVRQARVGLDELREELFGRQGFAGPTATLYHSRPPGDVLRIVGKLKPRMFSTRKLMAGEGNDGRGLPLPFLTNSDVTLSVSNRRSAMPYAYRDADGDLLYFIHEGTGVMATEYGPIPYEPGDYIYLPRGTTFRQMPNDGLTYAFVIESVQPIDFAAHPQQGRHFPFDPQLITVPSAEEYAWPEQDEWELCIRSQGELTSVFFEKSPFDVVGWKGDLFPFKINMRDIHTLSSERIHIAPTSWATFQAPGFVVVTFLPRPSVNDLDAEELPSSHRNIDCDEAIFVHSDTGREGASFIFSPQGIHHGPPDAFRREFNRKRVKGMQTMLTGVSVDTFKPLNPTPAMLAVADGETTEINCR
ncbi:homogentisate 1,2-dioxygenase [Bradyrhizobium sp. 2]|uniref:homogentisate 1,2-dioxygenase n=1 Tax=unclassified Bradyrhizobium TaxID=2631580 RepID=UPI001FF8F919|nr:MULTISPECIES: homogentisate 1,2-dioxygenase [unclassified Bradyrhizobium]MCK1441890.1 homogentisate 1,2-dioxygenase [Bradyrhizobium sp. 48]MCK1465635.1 homogentisate 1,2-dioxygenase [Bradyrhizobium sp. 2]